MLKKLSLVILSLVLPTSYTMQLPVWCPSYYCSSYRQFYLYTENPLQLDKTPFYTHTQGDQGLNTNQPTLFERFQHNNIQFFYEVGLEKHDGKVLNVQGHIAGLRPLYQKADKVENFTLFRVIWDQQTDTMFSSMYPLSPHICQKVEEFLKRNVFIRPLELNCLGDINRLCEQILKN